MRHGALLFGLLCLSLACAAPEAVPVGALISGGERFRQRDVSLGALRVAMRGSGWSDAHIEVAPRARPDAVFWSTVPGRAFVAGARTRGRWREARASFRREERLVDRCPHQTLDRVEVGDAELRLAGRLLCASRALAWELVLTADADGALRLALRAGGGALDRVALAFAARPDEAFLGFGEQFSHFDLAGRRVPILVQEQGIGRGRQPLTALVDLVAGAGGAWHTSYAPMPHFVSTKRRAFLLENTEPSVFDLTDPERVVVELDAQELRAVAIGDEDPLALIEAITARTGRMRALPDWIGTGAVVGLQGGTERVRDALADLEGAGAPVAAVWLQDWVGERVTSFGRQLWWNWELDRDRYPDWEAMVAELASRGIRVLTYVNPFLVDVSEKPNHRRNLLEEARAAGHLVRGADGEPIFTRITDFDAALVDLTRPEARDWLAGVIRQEVLGVGASGWMADFGEALPMDAVLASGEPAAAVHNRYPVDWARLNRRVIEQAGRGNDAVFFARSAFTRSPGAATLFWLGDQLTTWDEHDGMRSAIVGLLSGGVSGLSLNHGDVGGYTTLPQPLVGVRRSRELLWRWIELGAFQVVFRTHEGNLPGANHQVDTDAETLRHFARFARVYAAWEPYRRKLVAEAVSRGWPVLRHPLLHHPDEPAFRDITHEQFLIGSDLWFAPVTTPGRDWVEIRLPAGRYTHLFTGAQYESRGPEHPLHVPAPLGTPAVLNAGAVPLFELP